jgi:hypothetical protein
MKAQSDFAWAKGLGIAAAALGALVTLAGLAVMAMGQTLQGTMFAVIGALTCWSGYTIATTTETQATINAGKTDAAIASFGDVSNAALHGAELAGVGGLSSGGLGLSGASFHWDA